MSKVCSTHIKLRKSRNHIFLKTIERCRFCAKSPMHGAGCILNNTISCAGITERWGRLWYVLHVAMEQTSRDKYHTSKDCQEPVWPQLFM